MEQHIFSLIVEQQEMTWKALILELVSSGKMNPWDVDISALTKMFLERVRQMHGTELKVSAKMILCAALLLKIKSAKLIGDDLNEFDRLLAQTEVTEDQFYDDLGAPVQHQAGETPQLMPRTPQPRTRKVTIFDLVTALEKALETKHRRLIKIGSPEAEHILPHRPIDLQLSMKQVYKRMREYFTMHRTRHMHWSQLVGEKADRNTRLYTFMPLLHLGTQRKVELDQKEAFGDFDITLPSVE